MPQAVKVASAPPAAPQFASATAVPVVQPRAAPNPPGSPTAPLGSVPAVGAGLGQKGAPPSTPLAPNASSAPAASQARPPEPPRPGRLTDALREARPGGGDDLKRIRGIGVLVEKKLNGLGVNSYAQVASWTNADVERTSRALDLAGRIERESWIEQARILAAGGHTEFSRLFDRGEEEASG
jgi:predicted flap endonuclease-1-like 5' DNA nuclease